MLKRLCSLILCLVLAMGVFAGCTLFELDTEADMKKEVAVIEGRQYFKSDLKPAYASLTQEELIEEIEKNNLTDEQLYDKSLVYESATKRITKSELLQSFNSSAEEYIQNQGMSVEDALNATLDNLINRAILLDEIHYLMEAGELKKPTQTQLNTIWKTAYQQIDEEIYNQMDEIAKAFDKDPPVRLTPGTNPEVQYAVKTVEESEENINIDGDHVWTPRDSANTMPQKDDFLHLEGVRKFMTMVFSVMDAREYLLTEQQKDDLRKDKEKWEKLADKNPNDLIDVYPDLMNYFVIKYFFYDSAFDSLLISNLEKMVKDKETVTNEEVVSAYNNLLATQTNNFTNNTEAYITALDDTSQTIIFHPTNVKQYYVKHILIPFSDAQKEVFAANGKTSDTELKKIRDRLANEITSYEHRNGFDYIEGGLKTITQIENEIYSKMANKKGFSHEAELAFEEFIFKYNTDPGGFNNALGYGLRYEEASSFMKEFEDGANLLYERYLSEGDKAIGSLVTVTTDYGKHIMMLSSVVQPGKRLVSDFTDVMRTQTIYQKLEKELLTAKQDNAYTKYQNEIFKVLKSQRDENITTNEKVLKEILKSLGV